MEITVRNKEGDVTAKRGKRRKALKDGGVENQEINPATNRWRKKQ